MKTKSRLLVLAASLTTTFFVITSMISGQTGEDEPDAGWTLLAWNDLGMHCMDEDFSVFTILPPFNTINAHLSDPAGTMVGGDSGITLSYQAYEDPDGSQTLSGASATNFWEYADGIFGTPLAPDVGLLGNAMPGAANTPQAMHWNGDHSWWTAEGIPITPKDKHGDTQAYPMLWITARDAGGQLLASARVVAPVSSEMNCKSCHASNTVAQAMPPSGWVGDPDAVRDYRLNILKLHDEHRTDAAAYTAALSAAGYSTAGLYETVVDEAQPILCASCHASNALGTIGVAGVPALTAAMHAGHASAPDPDTGILLGDAVNTASCYQCHPGAHTRCLRGAMGSAFDVNGQPSISCQNCHGGMTEVGDPARTGWLQEPNCQSCHTGSEVNNSGEVRFLTSFLVDGSTRLPAENRFATTPDAPVAPHSLYRFSTGHGGMQCSACHGSPHAVYPTGERNDNLLSLDQQGHVGTISDCATCHQTDTARIRTKDGGPHGMHGVGEWWIKEHHDMVEHENPASLSQCQACHGTGDNGGVLSTAQGPRTFQTEKFGAVSFWEGQRIGCYDCHDGPHESRWFSQAKPAVQSFGIETEVDTTVAAPLLGTDADTPVLDYRIVNGPAHGRVSLAGTQIAYTPELGFSGTDFFTYCAMDGRTDSNLGIVSVSVGDNAGFVDSDGDGIADMLERAFGLKPDRISRRRAPQVTVVALPGGGSALQTTYDPSVIPPDLAVEVLVSNDLQSWSADREGLQTTTDAQGRITVTFTPPSASRSFMRYRVRRAE